jgi:hypothetical protein
MRCIVTVATEAYVGLQRRLLESLARAGWRGGLARWTGTLPPGSPPHEEEPYAFKLFALREAVRRGFESLLWLDSPCVAAGQPSAVFDRLERNGQLFVTAGDRLGNWSNDANLSACGLSRDAAMGVPLIHGSFIGLHLGRPPVRAWLEGMFAALGSGHFRGPYFSPHAPAEFRARRPGTPAGFVSRDPRAWGHRHDEAVGSALARRLGLAILPRAALPEFQLPG